jgi:hypothetical protein
LSTVVEFKTMLTMYKPVSILEQVDRRRGKMSSSEFFSAMREEGLLSEKVITIMTTSIVPSGKGLPTDSPEAAPAAKEAVVTQTTTPHKESNQEEVEVSS